VYDRFMARSVLALGVLSLSLASVAVSARASADECTPPVKVTWGAPASTPAPASTTAPASAAADESPVLRAREMLLRAKFLDDAATADDKIVTDITSRAAVSLHRGRPQGLSRRVPEVGRQ
jgi:hypothetical protein